MKVIGFTKSGGLFINRPQSVSTEKLVSLREKKIASHPMSHLIKAVRANDTNKFISICEENPNILFEVGTEETIRKRIVTSAAQATPDATLKEQGKNPDDYHNTVDNDNEKEIAKDVKDLKNGVKYLENQRLVLDHLLNMPRIIRESLDPAEKRNWIRKMVTADKRYKRKTTEENKHEAWSIYEKWKMEARLDKALATVSKMEKDLENKNTECK